MQTRSVLEAVFEHSFASTLSTDEGSEDSFKVYAHLNLKFICFGTSGFC